MPFNFLSIPQIRQYVEQLWIHDPYKTTILWSEKEKIVVNYYFIAAGIGLRATAIQVYALLWRL